MLLNVDLGMRQTAARAPRSAAKAALPQNPAA
jgi:hypothetical protein